MSSPVPVRDIWILARPKLKGGRKYYGAYPSGFLERARTILGASIDTPVLHVCSGMARYYPWPRGFGRLDKTLDLDPSTKPDFCQDAREPWPLRSVDLGVVLPESTPAQRQVGWTAIIIDPPYSESDADQYKVGRDVYPRPYELLKRASEVLKPGGRVGILHYEWARAPKETLRSIAVFSVLIGQGNNGRIFSVFERV